MICNNSKKKYQKSDIQILKVTNGGCSVIFWCCSRVFLGSTQLQAVSQVIFVIAVLLYTQCSKMAIMIWK